ncbi:unnamed protein product [Lactuca saligna]|uniref:Uncharacterized protein n=1 Tax=Lactuca saligna TaxID=75948 RepID=A0AA35Z0L0_LACSI|nr:unnamed protein product [Lactuca saligna]
MEDTFKNNLSKLPVLDPASKVIFLLDKCDVFLGDDIFLTDLFTKTFSRPIFVWFPQPSQKTLTRTKLVEIYTRLGVRTLSESVKKNTSDVDHDAFKPVDSKEKIIKKGLLKLILGFLADPNLKIEPKKRHESADLRGGSRISYFHLLILIIRRKLDKSESYGGGSLFKVAET